MQQQGIGTRWVQQVLLCAATTNECAPTAAKPQQEQAPVPLGMLFWKQWGKNVLKTAKLQPKGEILKDKLCRRIYIHQKHHSVRPGWAGRPVGCSEVVMVNVVHSRVSGRKVSTGKSHWSETTLGRILWGFGVELRRLTWETGCTHLTSRCEWNLKPRGLKSVLDL